MRDQLVMSKNNAEVAIAIPLFRFHKSEESVNTIGYELSIAWPESKPLAYVLDCGKFCSVVAAEWVEKHLEFICEL